MSVTSPFDASQSALGYLHQSRYALLLSLQRDDEPNLCISIEKLDDIAFHENPSSPAHAKELLQVKHHINRAGGLGDTSLDIWKTLRIWSEAVTKNEIDLDRATLCLLTTSTPTNRNAIRFLTPDPQTRKPQEGRAKLELAGAASTNDSVKEAYGVYKGLADSKRAALFDSLYLLDTSMMATDLQRAIGNAIRHAVEPRHRQAFVERLEGWWFHRLVIHLIATSNQPIPVVTIQQQVHEIRGQFQRDCLPDDLFNAPIPADATPTADDRVFVLQLVLIGLPPARLRIAQEDHYRAFAQRSKWIKDNLIGLEELTNFESRLLDGWRLRFQIMRDGMEEGCVELRMARHGMNLYQWVETDAPSQGVLWVRPQFQAQYMTRGSYHMLADSLRIGWHPEYKQRLAQSRGNGQENQR